LDGAENQISTQTSTEQEGIAQVDFAQSLSTSDKNDVTTTGSSDGLFFTSQGMSSVSTSKENKSTLTSQQSSSAQQSSTEQTSSSGEQIQSGKMTFTLPDFNKDNAIEAPPAKEDALSPTQEQETEQKIPGSF
jgi:glycogenin glucosyltransferase